MTENATRNGDSGLDAKPNVPALEVLEIHKSYCGQAVLRGVSMRAHDGEVIAILGSSGSGKSTFLRCINFLEVPESGAVRVGGEEVRVRRRKTGGHAVDQKQINRLRARIGFVFQSFNLWPHRSVLGNIIEAPVHVLGLPRAEAVARAEALLDKVGMADRRDLYPNQLSGGQRQRAAIARALAMEPDVILFDEPTSALDPELVGEVLGVIRRLADEGRTMLIVTHEIGFAREVSDRTLFLHEGRVEEEGPSGRMFARPDSDRLRRFLASHLN